MLFVTLGGFLFSGSASDSTLAGEVEVGGPVEVSGGVTIQPAAGWEQSETYADPPGILLGDGTGWLLVQVPEGTGTPQELLNFYVANTLEPGASSLSVGNVEPYNAPAGEAITASYVGVFDGVAVPIEGQVIAIVAPSGTGVALDGWAAQGLYAGVREQVEAMVETVVIP
jgi:hypothetical protein